MSTTEARFSVTIRTPGGTLLTGRGDTNAEAYAVLEALDTDEMEARVGRVEARYGPQAYATAALGATPMQDVNKAAPPPQAAPAAPQGGNQCPHGTRVFKSGSNKQSGKPWAAWFCPVDDKACKPEWTSSR